MTTAHPIRPTGPRGQRRPGAHLPAGAGPVSILLMVAALMLLAASPDHVGAQGWIDPLPRTAEWGVVKLRSDVTVRIDGRVAHVEVEEWFENRARGVGEGDYLYPLPGEAVFSDFSLYQGDHELRGETMDADRARAIYEEIVRSRRDPALIELVGHGLVRARVFPFEPGERRRITLRYTQVLDRAGDAVQFRYQAGRAHGWAGAGTDVPVGFTLSADADTYGRPFSPTHALQVDRRDGEIRVRPATELHGGFSVFLPLSRPVVGLALATHRPSREPGYFMLTLSPGNVRGAATPRDLTAVVDVSGSMAEGDAASAPPDPLERLERQQAVDRAREALARLSERDREALLLWDAGHSYRDLANRLGLSVGAVGTTLARARARLVAAMDLEEIDVARG